MSRHYPPAPLVHRPNCVKVADMPLRPMPTPDIVRRHPNARRHDCYQFHQNSMAVVEPVTYPVHSYRPSDVMYPDADKALCVVCGGTHGMLDALILPPGFHR